MINQNNKLADVLVNNQFLLPVINRLGIKLGFGEKNIIELTNEYNIDNVFFVELCNLVTSGGVVRPKYVDRFKTKWTIIYLVKSHQNYLTDYLVRIENFIQNLKYSDPNRMSDIKTLNKFFSDYKNDFIEHLKFEDNTLFPYIELIEQYYDKNEFDELIIKKIKKNSVSDYIKHHDSLYLQLNDFKNLFFKYLQPFSDEIQIINGLSVLYELENDLKTHELIENNILFSKVIAIEKYFLTLEKNRAK